MKKRCVIPEILDSLPHEDPEAERSRRDLSRVNALMGNYQWGARRISASGIQSWVELGSGGGNLAGFAESFGAELRVSAVDLAPRPAQWPDHWDWQQKDLFDFLPELKKEESQGAFSVLFLHHFESEALRSLGEMMDELFSRVVIVEPARLRIFWWLSHLLLPFVNRVTRHDMLVSIGAGFRRGELVLQLGLGEEWEVRETVHWFGGLRFEAQKETS